MSAGVTPRTTAAGMAATRTLTHHGLPMTAGRPAADRTPGKFVICPPATPVTRSQKLSDQTMAVVRPPSIAASHT
ncbi:hypothetical protein [Streptomyces sp. NPDC060022]|uniref:hypothetical protein n=1 Tax=Streptomyces sp. NPDC060022 TaxID=3347039 RepID=UPI003679DF96